jgi:hypothetical protein
MSNLANLATECLALLRLIPEVPGSNTGTNTGHPGSGFNAVY